MPSRRRHSMCLRLARKAANLALFVRAAMKKRARPYNRVRRLLGQVSSPLKPRLQ